MLLKKSPFHCICRKLVCWLLRNLVSSCHCWGRGHLGARSCRYHQIHQINLGHRAAWIAGFLNFLRTLCRNHFVCLLVLFLLFPIFHFLCQVIHSCAFAPQRQVLVQNPLSRLLNRFSLLAFHSSYHSFLLYKSMKESIKTYSEI